MKQVTESQALEAALQQEALRGRSSEATCPTVTALGPLAVRKRTSLQLDVKFVKVDTS